ncbi:hypothetical protein BGZ73_006485, partial [Actinomortierella ambigua]
MPSLIKRVKSIFRSNSKKDLAKKSAAPAAALAPVAEASSVSKAAPVSETAPRIEAPITHPKNDHEKHTLAALLKSDEQLAASGLADSPYAKAASKERFDAAKAGLEAKGFKVHVAQNKGEAFNTLKALIPKGASVNNAHSTTLEEI